MLAIFFLFLVTAAIFYGSDHRHVWVVRNELLEVRFEYEYQYMHRNEEVNDLCEEISLT